MIDKLGEHLRFNSEALRLRSTRQELLASNVINGETPRYQAKDFDFALALRNATAQPAAGAAPGGAMIAVSSPAMPAPFARAMPVTSGRAMPATYERSSYQPSLDGNSVDMDTERAHFVDNGLRYEAALRSISMQIKTMLSAIQG